MISQEELKRVLHYNSQTGVFTWKLKLGPRGLPGTSAGCPEDRYIRVCINGIRYPAHRLAFIYMTGSFPKYIDHKDRNGFNNKWENLREVTISQNAANSFRKVKNKAGFKGVKFMTDHARIKPWEASIHKNGKYYYIGAFKTAEEAAKAYDKKALELYGEYAKTNF